MSSAKENLMKRTLLLLLVAVLSVWFSPGAVFAGMPMITLSDLANFRLATLSLFLWIYVLTSFVIWKLWNYLRKDFVKLPQLTFKKALGLVLLWGLAFDLLLVMIAGTRELMTPEAWERAGVIHKIAPDAAQQLLDARRHKLDQLRIALWRFAEGHSGQFPPSQQAAETPEEVWVSPDGKLKYVYVGGAPGDKGMRPLAYEPDSYGHQRMVLFANGAIELLPIDAVQSLLKAKRS